MNKKLFITGTLLALLLTGCANTDKPSSSTVDNDLPTIESSNDIQLEPANELPTIESSNETQLEPTNDVPTVESNDMTVGNRYFISPYPTLMYSGELYYYLVYSSQIELEGGYYEVDSGVEAYIDTERIKNECEYIGESVPNPDPFATPSKELEVTDSDEVYQLYKIDENQVLLYSTQDLEIPESWIHQAIVYPGTFRRHYILIKADTSVELQEELRNKYYRFSE